LDKCVSSREKTTNSGSYVQRLDCTTVCDRLFLSRRIYDLMKLMTLNYNTGRSHTTSLYCTGSIIIGWGSSIRSSSSPCTTLRSINHCHINVIALTEIHNGRLFKIKRARGASSSSYAAVNRFSTLMDTCGKEASLVFSVNGTQRNRDSAILTRSQLELSSIPLNF
jgi:hypothetical protein